MLAIGGTVWARTSPLTFCPEAYRPDPSRLSENGLWQHGPNWLRERDALELPDDNEPMMPPECKLEQRAKKSHRSHSLLIPYTCSTPLVNLRNLINCNDFSSVKHLLQVTALVMKFIQLLKARKNGRNTAEVQREITATDIEEAEILWIREMQASLAKQSRFRMWHQQFGLFMNVEFGDVGVD